MRERAHVSSVDAIESFRTSLIVYLSKARPALEEVSADVMRVRLWLEDEQVAHWENEMKARTRTLQEAQQALFSSRLSNLRQETAAEVMAVHRARRAVDEADQKLRVLKRWRRDFENQVMPVLKQTEKLHTVLANDMVQAVAYLGKVLDTLAAYAEIKPPSAPAAPAPAGVPGGTGVTGGRR